MSGGRGWCLLPAVGVWLALGAAALAEDLSAWGECLPTRSIAADEFGDLRAPAGTKKLTLPYAPATNAPLVATDGGYKVAGGTLALTGENMAVLTLKGREIVIPAPASFALAGEATAVFAPPPAADATQMPPDAEGSITLTQGQTIKVKAIEVRPLPVEGDIDIHNTSDGPRVRLLVSRPGTTFDAQEQRNLAACVLVAGRQMAVPATIVAVETEDLPQGAALVTLRPPKDLFGGGSQVAFLVRDGDGLAVVGQLNGLGLWPALGLSIGATLLVLGCVAVGALGWELPKADGPPKNKEKTGMRHRRLKRFRKLLQHFTMGLFVGRDGDASLSLFQVFLWTIVCLWALLYVFCRTGDLLVLTQEVLALLGLASSSAVAARWIAGSREPAAPPARGRPAFWTILTSDDRPDLLKVQLLVFTLFGLVYVVYRVFANTALPVLGGNLLLLMGVSNLAYVGGKLAEPTAYQKADMQQRALDVAKASEQALTLRLAQEQAAVAAAQAAGQTAEQRKPLEDAAARTKDQLQAASKTVKDLDDELKKLIALIAKPS